MQDLQHFETFRKDFVRYLYNTKHVEEDNLETLKNLKIAINGSYLIHNIIRYGNINIFHGFSKYQLSRHIKRLLDCFQSLGIKAIVVLQGIVYNKGYKPNFQDITQKLRESWQKILEDPKDPEVPKLLNELAYHFFTEAEIVKILDELDIEYIHAPYDSVSQMKYLTEYSYAHLACCGLEGLLLGYEYIVVDFDLSNKKFYYIDIKKLRKAMNFEKDKGTSNDKMHTFFLFNGYNPFIHTFVPIDYLDYIQGKFKDVLNKEYCFETLKNQIGQGVNVLKNITASNDNAVHSYHQFRKKLEYNPVFDSLCEVDVGGNVSRDHLNDHCGPCFPSDVYTFFVFNLIDRELIDSIANGHFIIRPPLSDSAEYHHHIDNFYKIMLEKITGIFTAKLNSKFRSGANYSLIRFYFIEKNFVFTPREYKPAKFLLKQSFFDKEKLENTSKSKKIGFCKALQYFTECIREREMTVETKKPVSTRKESLDFVLTTKLSPLTKVNKNNSEDSYESNVNKGDQSPEIQDKSIQSPAEVNSEQPQTSQEILSYLYLSFLEMYDYVNTQNQTLMVIGAALRKCDENFEESLVMLLELMKPNLCLINGKEFSNSRPRKISSEAPFNTSDKREHTDHQFYQINLWTSNISDEQKEEIVLISRVFALINASISNSHAESNFADYDYDLCQYLNVLKHLQKMLRFSFEALLLNTYITFAYAGTGQGQGHSPRKNAKIFFGLKKSLPFRNNLNISLGIAIKKLLQGNETLAEFKEKNPQFVNLEYDLKAGYILWENVLFLLKYQESKGEFTVELLELFKNAHDLLTKRFRELELLE